MFAKFEIARSRSTEEMAERLEGLTGLEARVTILGHVQRGGIPSPLDRVLATRLGTACADAIAEGELGVMIASRGEGLCCGSAPGCRRQAQDRASRASPGWSRPAVSASISGTEAGASACTGDEGNLSTMT